MKRLDTGAFIKDYEGADKEFEQAVQLVLPEVISEDPRFLEQGAPPLSEEFPAGTKVFFLGEHAYGVAAQVQDTTESAISVVLAVSAPVIRCTVVAPLNICNSSSRMRRPRMSGSRTLPEIGQPLVTIHLLRSRRCWAFPAMPYLKSRQASWY